MKKKNFLILLLAVIFSSLVSWLKTNTADIGTVKWTHVIQSTKKPAPFLFPGHLLLLRNAVSFGLISRRSIPNFVLVSFTVNPFTTISLRTNITSNQERTKSTINLSQYRHSAP